MEVVLPDHIIEDILSRLPTNSLLRFRCVCKTWCNIISDCFFMLLHLKRSSERSSGNIKLMLKLTDDLYLMPDCENPNQVIKLVYPSNSTSYPYYLGSSNGLVCLQEKVSPTVREFNIRVWNPSTRKCAMIRQHLPQDDNRLFLSSAYSFFYDSITSDYKLLKITAHKDISSSQVMVYSFGENSWTHMADISYRIFHRHSVCEVWLMKNYGRKESWTKLFTINRPDHIYVPHHIYLTPLYIRSKGDVLVLIEGEGLFLYDYDHESLFNPESLKEIEKIDIEEKHPAAVIGKKIKNHFSVWPFNYVDSFTGFEISDGEHKKSSGER
ncbi:hypothetical protein AQUCO_05700064v1 [Aquilegia coerulea]|uniref:F-box domain-containing protein n=1 Tax=Aquilegia coerulea TaxID=218851 RepID=A0A2G5CFQ5_AQUCA|nr:hypothetical protein AQUCO_05700064v1 [Aquilegia coerulea]